MSVSRLKRQTNKQDMKAIDYTDGERFQLSQTERLELASTYGTGSDSGDDEEEAGEAEETPDSVRGTGFFIPRLSDFKEGGRLHGIHPRLARQVVGKAATPIGWQW